VTGNSYPLRRVRRRVAPGVSEAAWWKLDLAQAQHTQLDRVQASARVWLGLLTTLLTLLGSVVLVKGGSLVTEVTADRGLQIALIILVGLVFAVAVLALIFGGQATWGGLSSIIQSAGSADDEDSRKKSWWRRRWYGLAKFLALFRPKEPGDQEKASGKADWEKHRDKITRTAHKRWVYLHASRTMGVIAAGLIALLVIVALIVGTFWPPPSEVIVVHHGLLTCGSISDSKTFTGVTQVIPVANCLVRQPPIAS
jgi:hypothetical protein